MKVRFWGVRGSIPSPISPEEIRSKLIAALLRAQGVNLSDPKAVSEYVDRLPLHLRGTVGGNTPCVSIETGDMLLVFDAGSGLRVLGHHLMNGPFGQGNGELVLFITHTHWDHIQGFPFFEPAFVPGNRITFYSPYPDLERRLRGQQAPEYFPVTLDHMQATIEFVTLREGEEITVGDVRVRNILLAHPGRSYSYRVEADQAVLVYATDAEYKDLGEAHTQRYIEFMRGADLLIFDAQYTLQESFVREDWGHSSSLIGIDLATQAGVKRLVLFHHAPTYNDQQVIDILEETREYLSQDPTRPACEVLVAYEGLELEIGRPQAVRISRQRVGEVTLLRLKGRFDASAAGPVDLYLTRLISDDPAADIIIDLSEVPHMTVAGLKTLLTAKRRGQGANIVLAAPSQNVQRVLEQLHVPDEFTIYESAEAALAALEARRYLRLPGQKLRDRYLIQHKLAAGRTGAVFKAYDTLFDRPVVVKVLSDKLDDDRATISLLEEARAVARLSHPHIVTVYDCVRERGRLYLIREFLSGRSLREVLNDLIPGQGLPAQQVLSIARGVLDALGYAHRHKVMHRDLRPRSIILTETGVKLINFGLREDRTVDSVAYMAPELFEEGAEETPLSDLYAFGVVLYEMVCGLRPFVSDSIEELMRMHQQEPPLPPSRFVPTLPTEMEGVILKLLAKAPQGRFPTAEAVLEALEGVGLWEHPAGEG